MNANDAPLGLINVSAVNPVVLILYIHISLP
nr:MAG TPA: hypothetical protein [Caudoviricetes sp.]